MKVGVIDHHGLSVNCSGVIFNDVVAYCVYIHVICMYRSCNLVIPKPVFLYNFIMSNCSYPFFLKKFCKMETASEILVLVPLDFKNGTNVSNNSKQMTFLL